MLLNLIASMFISTKGSIDMMIENFGKLTTFVLLIAPFAIFYAGLWFWISVVHKQPVRESLTTRRSFDFKRFFTAFGLWAVFSIGVSLFELLREPDNYVFQFDATQFILLVVISLIFIPIQTSFEEHFFRGYFMQGIYAFSKSKWAALIISSVFFGMVHLGNPEIESMGVGLLSFYIGTGVFLGILTLKDQGLELAMGFHAANNIIGATLFTSKDSAFQTPALFNYVGKGNLILNLLVVSACYVILYFILSKIYKFNRKVES